MSLTLTLTGERSVLAASYFPPIDLSDGEYELGLTNFETYNTIPNVDSTNDTFHFGDDESIAIPEGSYELPAIEKYLRAALLRRNARIEKNDDEDDRYVFEEIDNEEIESPIVLRANESTMKCEIKCAYRVDFTKPNNIGSLLGFGAHRKLKENRWFRSDKSVNILKVNIVRVECNITTGAYSNGKSVHTIHEFALNVPPGYKLSETPTRVIYLPVIARNVTDIAVRVVDQNGCLINFRGEEITIRLHVRRRGA